MSARVNGLGHIGFYVRDLELMKDFYANFLGMTLTKVSAGAAFFSADPEACDHDDQVDSATGAFTNLTGLGLPQRARIAIVV